MKVIKRDCTEVEFDKEKIYNAILKAMPYGNGIKKTIATKIADEIEKEYLEQDVDQIPIYEIEQKVVKKLISKKQLNTAMAYEGYRSIREYQRCIQNSIDTDVLDLLQGTNDELNKENSNKDTTRASTMRDYIAGIVSKDLSERCLLPTNIVQAHKSGIIHQHDMDYYLQPITNCCLINAKDMFENGTCINGVSIDTPKRILTATTILTQIITAVSSSQYGGCSVNISHLAPFVRSSENEIREKYNQWKFFRIFKGFREKLVEYDLKKEVASAVQTFNYQINSMTNSNGQAPFISVFMYLNDDVEYTKETAMLIEEFFNQRISGMKNRVGVSVTQAFPKLLYVLDENNIHEDSEYWWLTKLACKCTAKRMVPDYISAKKMKELKEGNVFACMGCRSMLSPYKDEDGNYKFWGRFNMGVTTLNLPDVALSSEKDVDKFWEILDSRLELCHEAMLCRYEHLKGVKSDVAPILWQDGAFARLKPHETIDKLLKGGYATISLGYAGLYECVKYMTDCSLSDRAEGQEFALSVLKYINNKLDDWKRQDDLGYGLYGTPIESTTYKIAQNLKKRFGEDVFVKIDGIDRDFVTNSYHIPVFEEIDAIDKLEIEAQFQDLTTGGAISYIECCDLTNNTEIIENVVKYMYDNIMYAEFNTKSDYCQVCGSTKEMEMIDRDGELKWRCTCCGNEDASLMNVARRVCGYISTTTPNKGRMQDIFNRYIHIDIRPLVEKIEKKIKKM